ncbi:hypothetical protein [Paraflavitalea speifideaquila]|uniref:hypothetical protein n=1 Tax=Paraflavitalea speifideaquila TaxID=3076558 RepID=UPI0028E89104|nr:hypothetical protein [Paraflavitalea speifideiaquila]
MLDVKQLYVANRSASGALAGLQQLSSSSRLFFPGEHIVLTEDARWLQQQYQVKEPATILELPALPSLPDDKGTLVLINLQEEVVDELQYNRSWHFSLISNEDGVALERIDYSKPAQDSHNWMSAASTAGFGTPVTATPSSGPICRQRVPLLLRLPCFRLIMTGLTILLPFNTYWQNPVMWPI